MDSRKCLVLLIALACIAISAAGCTSSQPAITSTTPPTKTSTPAATVAQPAAQGTTGVASSSTPECPDKYEKGVWNGNWDTRWKSEGHDIAPDPNYPGYPWSGVDAPGATPVVLSQKCWDVTGTYIPAGNSGGSGTIIASIKGNQLKGAYKSVWSGSSDTEYGTFTLTMAADNQSWVGYAKGHDRGDYQDPDNWAGKRESSTTATSVSMNPVTTLLSRMPTTIPATLVSAPAGGISCRPNCPSGTKCNDEQDCGSATCSNGVCI
jgi:hypothetical protein